MKKIKLLNVLLIMIMVFAIPTVYAHDISLAGNNIIPIPNTLDSSTKIKVAESFGEYKLYYQWVKMSDDDYSDYMDYVNSQLQIDNPGANASDQDKQDYEEQLAAYEAEKTRVKPAYIENKWTESKDGSVPFNEPLEGVEKGDPYVLWVKAVSTTDESNVIYEENLILYSASLVQEEKEENAETSDGILMVGLLTVAAVGLMTISYKKSRA